MPTEALQRTHLAHAADLPDRGQSVHQDLRRSGLIGEPPPVDNEVALAMVAASSLDFSEECRPLAVLEVQKHAILGSIVARGCLEHVLRGHSEFGGDPPGDHLRLGSSIVGDDLLEVHVPTDLFGLLRRAWALFGDVEGGDPFCDVVPGRATLHSDQWVLARIVRLDVLPRLGAIAANAVPAERFPGHQVGQRS